MTRAWAKFAFAALAFGATSLGAATAQTGPYETTTTASIGPSSLCASPVSRTITVGESFTITDLDVGFLATHSWRTDIQLDLRSPAGTSVRLINGPANQNYNNYNVVMDDEASTLINNGSHASSDGTSAPPYENRVRPDNALSAFDGQNAQGVWTLSICDTYPGADNGQFERANLYFNAADLSLTKTASNSSPAVGANFNYALTVTNAGPTPASGVVVSDLLPGGISYVSDNGSGAYNSASGIWTIPGSIASGSSRTLQITVQAASSGTYVNTAEIVAANNSGSDLTPNNSGTSPSEDDTDFAIVTVGGSGGGGAPVLTCTGPSAGSTGDSNTLVGRRIEPKRYICRPCSASPFSIANRLINFGGSRRRERRTTLRVVCRHRRIYSTSQISPTRPNP
ncbi:MAG: proprotein convertase P-domain-containing protein [Parvularculaceae bacterium]